MNVSVTWYSVMSLRYLDAPQDLQMTVHMLFLRRPYHQTALGATKKVSVGCDILKQCPCSKNLPVLSLRTYSQLFFFHDFSKGIKHFTDCRLVSHNFRLFYLLLVFAKAKRLMISVCIAILWRVWSVIKTIFLESRAALTDWLNI